MHHVIHLLNDSQRISAPTARDEPSQRSLMDTLDGPGVSHVMLQLFFLCFIQNTVKVCRSDDYQY